MQSRGNDAAAGFWRRKNETIFCAKVWVMLMMWIWMIPSETIRWYRTTTRLHWSVSLSCVLWYCLGLDTISVVVCLRFQAWGASAVIFVLMTFRLAIGLLNIRLLERRLASWLNTPSTGYLFLLHVGSHWTFLDRPGRGSTPWPIKPFLSGMRFHFPSPENRSTSSCTVGCCFSFSHFCRESRTCGERNYLYVRLALVIRSWLLGWSQVKEPWGERHCRPSNYGTMPKGLCLSVA